MNRIDLSLPTPAENLALDEALLEWAEDENDAWEFLRIWEAPEPFVVAGRSTRIGQEIDEAACRSRRLPILRRSSGGAAVVAGPGCLMYAVVLSYRLRPELKDIRLTHRYVLGRFVDVLSPLLDRASKIRQAGTSDLVWLPRPATGDSAAPIDDAGSALKFSGNSLRARRTHLLYHGTLLYDFDLRLIEDCLLMPPRRPEYRGSRSHRAFLANLPIARQKLVEAIQLAWPAQTTVSDWPRQRVAQLVADRFHRDQWNYEFT